MTDDFVERSAACVYCGAKLYELKVWEKNAELEIIGRCINCGRDDLLPSRMYPPAFRESPAALKYARQLLYLENLREMCNKMIDEKMNEARHEKNMLEREKK